MIDPRESYPGNLAKTSRATFYSHVQEKAVEMEMDNDKFLDEMLMKFMRGIGRDKDCEEVKRKLEISSPWIETPIYKDRIISIFTTFDLSTPQTSRTPFAKIIDMDDDLFDEVKHRVCVVINGNVLSGYIGFKKVVLESVKSAVDV